LLFPFIAIRLIASEKASGGLKLLVQLPYRLIDLVAAKFCRAGRRLADSANPGALGAGLVGSDRGHLDTRETATLMLGHLLYAFLIGAISFLAAALTEGGATAAILALGRDPRILGIGFAALDRGGVSSLLAALSMTSLLRPFEQGLLSVPTVSGMLIATAGFLALSAIWLPPGASLARRVKGRTLILVVAASVIAGASQRRRFSTFTPDRRNSFPPADEKLLGRLQERLLVTVHLASSDPRLVDLDRKISLGSSARCRRSPSGSPSPIRRASWAAPASKNYGEIVLTYHGKSATTRSTGAGENPAHSLRPRRGQCTPA